MQSVASLQDLVSACQILLQRYHDTEKKTGSIKSGMKYISQFTNNVDILPRPSLK